MEGVGNRPNRDPKRGIHPLRSLLSYGDLPPFFRHGTDPASTPPSPPGSRTRFGAPTEPQARAWPEIQAGRHTLIAAPTGSGKTLAAFLSAIDDLVRQALAGEGCRTRREVVYVSPLKALSNDVREEPGGAAGGDPRRSCAAMGLPDVEIRTLVRTGDTPASRADGDGEAAAAHPGHHAGVALHPAHQRGRARGCCATARTVIVDEIHAVADDKRGSHLALSLERLEALAAGTAGSWSASASRPRRSRSRRWRGSWWATRQCRADGTPRCAIVDAGHGRRDWTWRSRCRGSPLEAVMSAEVWEEIYDRLAELIREHRTTLVFANTRRLAERVTRHLAERLGEDRVAAHHGSLSKEQRLDAEQRLKTGELSALVATASLELGIDIGAVDLVCQIGSTRSIATLLQRVGRSGHHLGGLPKGRLFPLTRDELVECAALLDAVRRGELDRLIIPEQPLDILAQQIVARGGGEEWREDDLFALVRRAWPYRDLDARGLRRGPGDARDGLRDPARPARRATSTTTR